jgi:hypothetical protein
MISAMNISNIKTIASAMTGILYGLILTSLLELSWEGLYQYNS